MRGFALLFIVVCVFLLCCNDQQSPESQAPQQQPVPAPLSRTQPISVPITYDNTTGRTFFAKINGEIVVCPPGTNQLKAVLPAGDSQIIIPLESVDQKQKGALKVTFYSGPSMTMEYIPE
jgi:hypothetical protein